VKRRKKDVALLKGREKAEASDSVGSKPAAGASGEPALSIASAQSVPQQEIVTSSPEETFELGRSVAAKLTGPAIILLTGDLGAGKTVLAKGIAAGLDIDPADITSPSFTIINVHHGRLRFYHVDLYRLDRSGCEGLGLEEIFDDTDAITVIEWAERLPRVPERAIRFHIEYLTEGSRKILISDAIGRASREFDEQVRSQ
jgi:tRNA threonylcarbamoyladenosine biosynthesis protein TsaE